MDAHDWLSRYPTLLAEAHELTAELESLGDPGHPQLRKYRDNIEHKLNSYIEELEQMQTAISALPDPTQRLIIRKRYTGGDYGKLKPWGEIAMEFRGRDDEVGLKWVRRRHNKGIAKIQVPEAYQS